MRVPVRQPSASISLNRATRGRLLRDVVDLMIAPRRVMWRQSPSLTSPPPTRRGRRTFHALSRADAHAANVGDAVAHLHVLERHREMWIRDVDYECWREACRTYLIASATSGAQSDVDASPSHQVRSQRTRQRGAGGTRSVARCAPCVAHHAISRRERAGHRRLDAWSVERAGRSSNVFRWSPATARRVLGNASLRRLATQPRRFATPYATNWAIRCCAPRRGTRGAAHFRTGWLRRLIRSSDSSRPKP